MIEFVREYIVKEEAHGQFELAYGPGGMWSKLFGKSPGFRGITVLRDEKNAQRYLAIEVWDSESQRAQAFEEGKAEHNDLIVAFKELTDTKTEIGTFSVRAQAAVRPQTKIGRSKAKR